jgi:putative membrane protein
MEFWELTQERSNFARVVAVTTRGTQRMNKLLFFVAAAALAGSHTLASAADKASSTFLVKAIEGNFAEVQMGELAQKNGQSAGVKSFGEMLQSDHSAANEKALDVAKELGVNAPQASNTAQKQAYDRMAKMSGAAFDKAFAQHMVADHKKDIAEYRTEAKRSDVAGKYATDTLPTLEKHLETAQSLQSETGTSATH